MKNSEPLWTLDELAAAVEKALSEGYEGAASGRVRDVPDRRTIRYYTTLGLIDRPAAMRGRTALYGRRHLLQLVAIKKLQARGRSLTEVQQELTGQTDRELAQIAGQETPEGPGGSTVSASPRSDRDFWRQEPEAPEPSESASTDAADRAGVRRRSVGERSSANVPGRPAGRRRDAPAEPERPIDVDDLEAIRSAAAPLIRTLTRSRLIDTPKKERTHDPIAADDSRSRDGLARYPIDRRRRGGVRCAADREGATAAGIDGRPRADRRTAGADRRSARRSSTPARSRWKRRTSSRCPTARR